MTLWSTAQIPNKKTSPLNVGNYPPTETGIFSNYNVQSWILHVEVNKLPRSTPYKEKVLEPTLKFSSENSLDWQ
jgi:hypothetical protein